ncbi:hypothetical protein LJR225_002166 [Phenylobacterium sp. LjRoot225]|uniref:hypothetical protein n=1 Tax=Phenylobacterium sp. LjRoot225 TaxID=3342285 RepID=UPI003ECD94DA
MLKVANAVVGRNAAETHPLFALSAAAVRYGVCLRSLSQETLAARLYAFNTTPVSAEWRVVLPDVNRTRAWLGLEAMEERLRRIYERAPSEGGTPHWFYWRRRRAAGSLRHKLYVSPRAEALPSVFRKVVGVCCELGAPAFKVGVGAIGVLRPDKLVLYFDSREDLWRAADELETGLAGEAAHGVPFTAPLDPAGLLSWGFDPGAPYGSWRQMVTDILARGLRGAPADGGAAEPYAFDILRHAGVDPDGWRPLGAPGL